MKNQNQNLNKLIKISLLAAIGFILSLIEIGLPIFPNFLKLDLGDLPALIGGFALGPVAGITIELLKNVLHGVIKGASTAFIGETANFIVGSVLVYTSAKIYSLKKTRSNAIIGLAIGTILMSVVASILNFYVFLPLYESVLGFKIAAVVGMGTAINPYITNLNTFIVFSILPFNLLKGAIVSGVTLALYKSVSPLIHKENMELERKNKLETN